MYYHSKSVFVIYNIFIYSNISLIVLGYFQKVTFNREVFDESDVPLIKSVLLQAVTQNSIVVGKFKTWAFL